MENKTISIDEQSIHFIVNTQERLKNFTGYPNLAKEYQFIIKNLIKGMLGGTNVNELVLNGANDGYLIDNIYDLLDDFIDSSYSFTTLKTLMLSILNNNELGYEFSIV